jgi:hypothetical protein
VKHYKEPLRRYNKHVGNYWGHQNPKKFEHPPPPHLPHPPHAQMKIIKPLSCMLPHFSVCAFEETWGCSSFGLSISQNASHQTSSGWRLIGIAHYGTQQPQKNLVFKLQTLGVCGGETLADPLPNELDLGVSTACQVRSAFYCASITTHMHNKLPRIQFFPHDTW